MRALASFALPAAALLGALLLPACSRNPVRQDVEEQAAALRDLPLPEVRSAGLTLLGSYSRVILRPEGIDADNIELIRSLPQESGKALYESLPPAEAAALPVVHRQLVPLSRWAATPPEAFGPDALEIRPLRLALDYMVTLDKEILARDPVLATSLTLNVHAAADAPYELLIRALYTAGQAEYVTWALAVRGPQGEGAIPVRAPQYADPRKPECVIPSLKLGPKGIAVRVQGRTIAGAPGACPTLPRKDGRHDTEALASLLGKIKDAVLTCGEAQVGVELPATWGEVAPVLAAVAVDAHYKDFSLAVPLGGAQQGAPDCSGAIELAALAESLKQQAGGTAVGVPPSPAAPMDPASAPAGKAPPAGKAAPAPSGSVMIGGAAVNSGSPTNERVVAGMSAAFRRCYNRALAEDGPGVAGTMRVTAKIGPNGEVLSATPEAKELPASLVSCVVARVQSAQFPPPPGGGAKIVIPVTFKPQ